METIEIPESVALKNSPRGICETVWYAKQPDGPVYFHNWYCRIKGTYLEDTLVIKEGTIGVIEGARGGKTTKRIVLPESLQYIAVGAFLDCEELEEFVLPEHAEKIRIMVFESPDKPFSYHGERSIKGKEGLERINEMLYYNRKR